MTYIDVFTAPVPEKNREDYIRHATAFSEMFKRHGALDYVEAWADDVPKGKKTCYNSAVQREEGEAVITGWTIWPDKATRDAAWGAMENDPTMKEFGHTVPFDGSRLIYGGFTRIV